MKEKLEKIYLDTSVISAYWDKREKHRQEDTILFWKITIPKYKVYISEITLKELKNTKDSVLRNKFLALVKNFKVLKSNKYIKGLAKEYIQRRVFSEKYFDDAMHVAVASYHSLQYLVSWNYEHMVKVKTRKLVNLVNALNGVREIEIVSPVEL